MIVPTGTRARYALGELPSATEPRTRRTLELMRALASQGSRDPVVIATANDIVRRAGVAPRSLAALEAVFAWVRDHIAFRRGPRTLNGVRLAEFLATPRATLEKRAEDCDGKAVLLVALARALWPTLPIRFRAIAAPPSLGQEFTHVYAVAEVDGRRVPLDATYSGAVFGWEYPRPLRVMEMTA